MVVDFFRISPHLASRPGTPQHILCLCIGHPQVLANRHLSFIQGDRHSQNIYSREQRATKIPTGATVGIFVVIMLSRMIIRFLA